MYQELVGRLNNFINMEKILSNIRNAKSKTEVWYLVSQSKKYRKKNGRFRKYLSHCYYYKDLFQYRKVYVRVWDVQQVSDEIVRAKKQLDSDSNSAIYYISLFDQYSSEQRYISQIFANNPELFTERAKLSFTL